MPYRAKKTHIDMYTITIGRQFGSGGRELGRRLAERLGIPFYDKELLLQAAQESGISSEFFEKNDEKMPTIVNGLFPFGFGVNSIPWYSSPSSISDDGLYKTQADFIREIAQRGPCIIVGRTADYVLRDMPNIINIFVHANMEDCVKRIISRNDSVEPEKARKMAERTNKLRANFYNFYTDKRWGHATSYDLCFNSSLLSMDQCVELVLEYMRHRLGDDKIGR